jgi:hypothetical protein
MLHVHVKPDSTWATTWTNAGGRRRKVSSSVRITTAEITLTNPRRPRWGHPEKIVLYLQGSEEGHLYRSLMGVEKRRKKNERKRKRKAAKLAKKTERKRRRRQGKIAPGPPYGTARQVSQQENGETPPKVRRRDARCHAATRRGGAKPRYR